jgi:2-hydroxychromene-2-carboxylate isomerase
VLDLADRLADRDVALVLQPVVARGIPDDPAVGQKRRYAITDARRLARRSGRQLRREEPLDAEAAAFLADWVAAGPAGPALTRFTVRALERLWFGDDLGLDEAPYAALWRAELGTEPPVVTAEAVHRCERRMRRRGPYDTPAAWVHGQWFFAHDRGAQIADRLDGLGWTVAA